MYLYGRTYLNTSHVTVQPELCNIKLKDIKFKYILRYCSTNPIQRKKRDKLRLNTSHVIVQQMKF
ncbi:hypothetical protein ACV3NQ_02000 [Clostridium perfringens]|nr:hypothetical protein [Clostridium perfringens]MDK0602161.1 hypothetical protein [Clostridium perfringens]